MNPLSQALEELASRINDVDAALVREAAGEIAIASNSVQAATMLALTTAEKFTEYQRRNDELLNQISVEVERHRATKALLAEAMDVANRATTMAEGLNAEVTEIVSLIHPQPNKETIDE